MINFRQLFIENLDNILYHVTYTKNIPKIRKFGLRPMQTSNWTVSATGARYGNGEIYVFEKFKDAIRWATKMDWNFNSKWGSGKISIVSIKDTGEWELDSSSPFEQAGHEGKWLKKMRAIPPEDIVDTIVVTSDVIKQLQK